MKLTRNTYLRQIFCLTAMITASLLLASCGQSSTPTPNPPTPTSVAQAISFQFEFLTPSSNSEFSAGSTITADGTHNLAPESHVWIFLKDTFGGYYLQSPAVELLSGGTWEATNIRLGEGIASIIAIYVDTDGNDTIQQWVNSNRWGQINEKEIKDLSGYSELGRVKVIVK